MRTNRGPRAAVATYEKFGELRKLAIEVSATVVRSVLADAGTVWRRRLHVLVFPSISSRRVEYVARTGNPDTAWMLQQARNLLIDLEERGCQVRFLVHDRDSEFSAAFDAVFASEGIRIIRTPVRAPNANAHFERWWAASAASVSTGC